MVPEVGEIQVDLVATDNQTNKWALALESDSSGQTGLQFSFIKMTIMMWKWWTMEQTEITQPIEVSVNKWNKTSIEYRNSFEPQLGRNSWRSSCRRQKVWLKLQLGWIWPFLLIFVTRSCQAGQTEVKKKCGTWFCVLQEQVTEQDGSNRKERQNEFFV